MPEIGCFGRKRSLEWNNTFLRIKEKKIYEYLYRKPHSERFHDECKFFLDVLPYREAGKRVFQLWPGL